MTQDVMGGRNPLWSRLYWALAAVLVLTPAVAMRFTGEVNWTASDFVFAAAMLGGAGLAYELLSRRGGGLHYRAGAALALAGIVLLVWINGAVGIVGDEGDRANLMYAAVVAIVVGGALLGRLRALAMARTMGVAAVAQAAIGAVAVIGRLGTDGPVWPRDVIGATAIFVALWLLAAALFLGAARRS